MNLNLATVEQLSACLSPHDAQVLHAALKAKPVSSWSALRAIEGMTIMKVNKLRSYGYRIPHHSKMLEPIPKGAESTKQSQAPQVEDAPNGGKGRTLSGAGAVPHTAAQSSTPIVPAAQPAHASTGLYGEHISQNPKSGSAEQCSPFLSDTLKQEEMKDATGPASSDLAELTAQTSAEVAALALGVKRTYHELAQHHQSMLSLTSAGQQHIASPSSSGAHQSLTSTEAVRKRRVIIKDETDPASASFIPKALKDADVIVLDAGTLATDEALATRLVDSNLHTLSEAERKQYLTQQKLVETLKAQAREVELMLQNLKQCVETEGNRLRFLRALLLGRISVQAKEELVLLESSEESQSTATAATQGTELRPQAPPDESGSSTLSPMAVGPDTLQQGGALYHDSEGMPVDPQMYDLVYSFTARDTLQLSVDDLLSRFASVCDLLATMYTMSQVSSASDTFWVDIPDGHEFPPFAVLVGVFLRPFTLDQSKVPVLNETRIQIAKTATAGIVESCVARLEELSNLDAQQDEYAKQEQSLPPGQTTPNPDLRLVRLRQRLRTMMTPLRIATALLALYDALLELLNREQQSATQAVCYGQRVANTQELPEVKLRVELRDSVFFPKFVGRSEQAKSEQRDMTTYDAEYEAGDSNAIDSEEDSEQGKQSGEGSSRQLPTSRNQDTELQGDDEDEVEEAVEGEEDAETEHDYDDNVTENTENTENDEIMFTEGDEEGGVASSDDALIGSTIASPHQVFPHRYIDLIYPLPLDVAQQFVRLGRRHSAENEHEWEIVTDDELTQNTPVLGAVEEFYDLHAAACALIARPGFHRPLLETIVTLASLFLGFATSKLEEEGKFMESMQSSSSLDASVSSPAHQLYTTLAALDKSVTTWMELSLKLAGLLGPGHMLAFSRFLKERCGVSQEKLLYLLLQAVVGFRGREGLDMVVSKFSNQSGG